MATRRPFIAWIDSVRKLQISCEVLEVLQSYRQEGPRVATATDATPPGWRWRE